MGNTPDELEKRIARCERTLYGEDDTSEGLSSRMHTVETNVSKIDATLAKLNWLIIAGVLVGLLNLVLNRPDSSISSPASNHQSVNVGEHASPLMPSAKTWLTTQDVAKREHVTDRTVINYIESGMIIPTPEKLGKEWHIAEDYRILPNDAETCGITN